MKKHWFWTCRRGTIKLKPTRALWIQGPMYWSLVDRFLQCACKCYVEIHLKKNPMLWLLYDFLRFSLRRDCCLCKRTSENNHIVLNFNVCCKERKNGYNSEFTYAKGGYSGQVHTMSTCDKNDIIYTWGKLLSLPPASEGYGKVSVHLGGRAVE